mgnify:CR=1 FL=1
MARCMEHKGALTLEYEHHLQFEEAQMNSADFILVVSDLSPAAVAEEILGKTGDQLRAIIAAQRTAPLVQGCVYDIS